MNYTNTMIAYQNNAKAWFATKAEGALVAFFSWALSKRGVQNVVAEAFQRGPLRLLLADTADEARRHLDASDIEGLEQEIEASVSSALSEIDCDDIRGLDRLIENIIDVDAITDQVGKELGRRLRES